jgi:hypothetical protein
MSTIHSDHHYSITILTEDLALVGCLRALSQHCQKTGNARIPWGGTSKDDWKESGGKVTFRFSKQSYREDFIAKISRLLPERLFRIVGQRDDDPATPARSNQ